ncbi:MAG: transposase [Anaerolineae bacterium]|jgi:putative transposase
MGNDTPKLTDDQVLEHTSQSLEAHLPLVAEGYKCTTEYLLHILLIAAARGCTIEAACAELSGGPSAETVRQYLHAQLTPERLPEFEASVNELLASQVPARLWRKAQDIAMDLHDRPYYGKTPQEEGLWVGGQAKAGTTHFYRVATAYVIHNGLRMTLALRFYLPTDSVVGVLEMLVERVEALGIGINRLLLDKGFDGIDVQTYLEQSGVPSLIACSIRGKTGGTRALCKGRESYSTTHTFRNNTKKKERTANVAVCRVFTTNKRRGRMERRGEWLVFILINLDLTAKQARRLYQRRFGVETSYRCAGQVRAWTTTKNAVLRFLLIGLSFFLQNVWLFLRWLYTQVPRRGRRRLDTKRFTLARFARFIVSAAERRYGCIHEITAPAVPIP